MVTRFLKRLVAEAVKAGAVAVLTNAGGELGTSFGKRAVKVVDRAFKPQKLPRTKR